MAVNLSPRQLADDDVVRVVREALLASGLPAHQLTLEVTEGVLVRDVDQVVDQLRALRALGVRIAIDDFGTGLLQPVLPPAAARGHRQDRPQLHLGTRHRPGASTTLVATIIELARSLHLEVVAEGVETAEQQAVLRILSCSHAQGYLFGRPLPAADQQPDGALTLAKRPAAEAGRPASGLSAR